MIPNLLIAASLEATAQYIAEPYQPKMFTREEHLHTVRRYVWALHTYREEHHHEVEVGH